MLPHAVLESVAQSLLKSPACTNLRENHRTRGTKTASTPRYKRRTATASTCMEPDLVSDYKPLADGFSPTRSIRRERRDGHSCRFTHCVEAGQCGSTHRTRSTETTADARSTSSSHLLLQQLLLKKQVQAHSYRVAQCASNPLPHRKEQRQRVHSS